MKLSCCFDLLLKNCHLTSTYLPLYQSQDGEAVEFEVITEPNGRSKAFNVTGPDGSYVQGAPKRFNNDFGHDDRGY